MPSPKINFETVRKLAAKLGEVQEATTRGAPSLKAHGRLLAWIPVHKSAEPNSLAIRLDPARRAELIEADPNVYYVTDHYINYPTILVRLERIHPEALKDLLRMAWST